MWYDSVLLEEIQSSRLLLTQTFMSQIFNSEFLEKGSIFGGNLRVRISFFCAIIKNHRRKIGNLSRSVLENSDKVRTWFPLFFRKKFEPHLNDFGPAASDLQPLGYCHRFKYVCQSRLGGV